jgi:hypothetical protein
VEAVSFASLAWTGVRGLAETEAMGRRGDGRERSGEGSHWDDYPVKGSGER